MLCHFNVLIILSFLQIPYQAHIRGFILCAFIDLWRGLEVALENIAL